VTDDAGAVLQDDSLDLVVEVMGGEAGAARDVVLGCGARGVHVVTANKALLAAALPEVARAFSGPRRPRLGYEASVAGAVPVLRALRESLLPENVTRVRGILNGTTNFILSAMAAPGGGSFAAELARAQAAGFAEADASADVDGLDARNKLVLLARLAFGVTVAPHDVRCEGIARVSAFDFACARELGRTVKLLGSASVEEDPRGGRRRGAAGASAEPPAAAAAPAAAPEPVRRLLLDLGVSPALVRADSALGATGGALNLVQVDGEFSGRTSYAGAGAGALPTAVSVVADMAAIALRTCGSAPFPRPPPSGRRGLAVRVAAPEAGAAAPGSWYVRGPAASVAALRARAGAAVERAGLGAAHHAQQAAVAAAAAAAAEGPQAAVVLAGLPRAALGKLLARAAGGDAKAARDAFVAFPVEED